MSNSGISNSCALGLGQCFSHREAECLNHSHHRNAAVLGPPHTSPQHNLGQVVCNFQRDTCRQNIIGHLELNQHIGSDIPHTRNPHGHKTVYVMTSSGSKIHRTHTSSIPHFQAFTTLLTHDPIGPIPTMNTSPPYGNALSHAYFGTRYREAKSSIKVWKHILHTIPRLANPSSPAKYVLVYSKAHVPNSYMGAVRFYYSIAWKEEKKSPLLPY